jgi:predicted component of type VI protein secretion system
LARMKQQLEAEWESLLEEASRLTRQYWDKVHEARFTRDFSEWNKYGVRVRRRKTVVTSFFRSTQK